MDERRTSHEVGSVRSNLFESCRKTARLQRSTGEQFKIGSTLKLVYVAHVLVGTFNAIQGLLCGKQRSTHHWAVLETWQLRRHTAGNRREIAQHIDVVAGDVLTSNECTTERLLRHRRQVELVHGVFQAITYFGADLLTSAVGSLFFRNRLASIPRFLQQRVLNNRYASVRIFNVDAVVDLFEQRLELAAHVACSLAEALQRIAPAEHGRLTIPLNQQISNRLVAMVGLRQILHDGIALCVRRKRVELPPFARANLQPVRATVAHEREVRVNLFARLVVALQLRQYAVLGVLGQVGKLNLPIKYVAVLIHQRPVVIAGFAVQRLPPSAQGVVDTVKLFVGLVLGRINLYIRAH